MSTRLVLISDTHIPGRARGLPDAVLRAADDADLVVHAGDWVTAAVIDELQQHADVLGVWGNNDDPSVRARMPEVARRDLEGVRFAVSHEIGPAKGREKLVDTIFTDVDVLVFGHSHIPWDSTSERGIRLLNPGSPTDRRRQPHATYMTAVVEDGALREVELVAL
ncbi:metallophosphoesterase family protein [Microbacterium sp. B2969]|uniref:Phosphoesterase n=1 Tax=Microbacterium alkaliflavum TaxID=3248839 RepID=A0ABW7Q3H7_9MICO